MSDKKELLIAGGIGGAFVIWLALLIAPFAGDGLQGILQGSEKIFAKPFDIKFCEDSMKCVLVLLAAYTMGIIIYASSQGNYRRGIEHGSAKWAITERVAKRYANKREPFNAKILTQNVQLSYNAMEHRRNMHVMVVGGSGSGKTRFFAKPNLLQSNTSFVVLDPNGKEVLGYILQAVH